MVLEFDEKRIDDDQKTNMLDWAWDLHPQMLLFLRRLKLIHVIGEQGTRKRFSCDPVQKENLSFFKLVSKHIQPGNNATQHEQPFVLFEHQLDMRKAQTEARPGQTSTVIKIAFPCRSEGKRLEPEDAFKGSSHYLFAFLPMRFSGFRFVIHADFVTSTNREDFKKDLPWNKLLLDQLPRLIAESLMAIVESSSPLRFSCLRWLPGSDNAARRIVGFDDTLRPVAQKLVELMRQMRCVIDTDGDLQRGRDCVSLRREFIFQNEPIIRTPHLYVASSSYKDVDTNALRCLDCMPLKPSQLLQGLGAMSREEFEGKLQSPGLGWFKVLLKAFLSVKVKAEQLKDLCCIPAGPSCTPKDEKSLRLCQYRHPRLLLTSQDAAAQKEFENLDRNVLFVPKELHQRADDIDKFLSSTLAVRRATSITVADVLLAIHRRPSFTREITDLLRHQCWLERIIPGNESAIPAWPQDYRVMTTKDTLVPLPAVYIDQTGMLEPALGKSGSHCIHKAYLESETTTHFLLKHGAKIGPTIVGGTLPADLKHMTRDTTTADAFISYMAAELHAGRHLVKDWLSNHSFVNAMQELHVVCSDGQLLPLKQVYLQTEDLRDCELPYVVCPAGRVRQYRSLLEHFGVTTTQNQSHYLKTLGKLSEAASTDLPAIARIYKKLEAYTSELDCNRLRQEMHDNKLIYNPASGRWQRLAHTEESVFWDCSLQLPCFRYIETKQRFLSRCGLILKNHYPDRRRLFANMLEIDNLSPVNCHSLLRSILPNPVPGLQPIEDSDVCLVNEILDEMSRRITDETSASYKAVLDELPIYILRGSSGEYMCTANDGRCFIADDVVAAQVFVKDLRLLAIEPSQLPLRKSLYRLAEQPVISLADVVQRTKSFSGQPVSNVRLTQSLQRHAEDICRWIYVNDTAKVSVRLASMLSRAEVYQVERISQSLSINLDTGVSLQRECPNAYAMHTLSAREAFSLFIQAEPCAVNAVSTDVREIDKKQKLFDEVTTFLKVDKTFKNFLGAIWQQPRDQVDFWLDQNGIVKMPVEYSLVFNATIISDEYYEQIAHEMLISQEDGDPLGVEENLVDDVVSDADDTDAPVPIARAPDDQGPGDEHDRNRDETVHWLAQDASQAAQTARKHSQTRLMSDDRAELDPPGTRDLRPSTGTVATSPNAISELDPEEDSGLDSNIHDLGQPVADDEPVPATFRRADDPADHAEPPRTPCFDGTANSDPATFNGGLATPLTSRKRSAVNHPSNEALQKRVRTDAEQLTFAEATDVLHLQLGMLDRIYQRVPQAKHQVQGALDELTNAHSTEFEVLHREETSGEHEIGGEEPTRIYIPEIIVERVRRVCESTSIERLARGGENWLLDQSLNDRTARRLFQENDAADEAPPCSADAT
ncbi:hypothetical protein PYCC9005_003583 [Savitreella phatthalungensis]